MIAECLVLLAVQHFKQRGGGVAVRVAHQFIHLVEQNQRIHHARMLQRVDDSARHRAHITDASILSRSPPTEV